ncbi:unnamed protein product [Musa hybrid cultivar]
MLVCNTSLKILTPYDLYEQCATSFFFELFCFMYVSFRIPGDGRCLFRSVVHGACLRAGKPSPSESIQKELADELRSKVADEFIRRRTDTEWFLEGDFDTYVKQIRKPQAWGGEPELLMCSHVLRMPITVYMSTDSSDGLKIIAEYGQEYGKENPIRVLYHGYGHYDALQMPLTKTKSKWVTFWFIADASWKNRAQIVHEKLKNCIENKIHKVSDYLMFLHEESF